MDLKEGLKYIKMGYFYGFRGGGVFKMLRSCLMTQGSPLAAPFSASSGAAAAVLGAAVGLGWASGDSAVVAPTLLLKAMAGRASRA